MADKEHCDTCNRGGPPKGWKAELHTIGRYVVHNDYHSLGEYWLLILPGKGDAFYRTLRGMDRQQCMAVAHALRDVDDERGIR